MKSLTRIILIFVMVSYSSLNLTAQNVGFPPNAKHGECYKLCFYQDKPFKWETIDCNKSILRNKEKTEEDILCQEKETQKIINHQEKLKELGYNVDINGALDDKTFFAHNKYLKQTKRAEKKAKK